ncbi:MAG TPA: Vms1/Ankzf1 family peptidyl-tRNA hydrolase, partial [Acidimicrobiales bacterium]|nr:Vms1/Ankzf1 family peptidyl-tRNA hydrolase [Acidimicrobiales bacterium]
MKTAGTTPSGGVDLSDWKHLIDGPFLSVYVPTESAVANATPRSDAEWRTLRTELLAQGAPEEALAHVDPLVPDAHLRGETLAVIATPDGVQVVDYLPEAVPAPRGSWGPVADLVPIIKARQSRIPFVTARADHGGADVTGYGAHRVIEKTSGDGDPMPKSAPGGWSQPRFAHRAENDWAKNAADAAEEVRKMAERVDARTIIVGGDVRATHMLADHLPRDADVHIIDPGRANDGSEESRDEEVRRIVNTAVA